MTDSTHKKIFLTGGTGFIGERLALRLADAGHEVHCLVRTPSKASTLNQHANIQVLQGDLMDAEVIKRGLENADEVYHLAALASPWHRDPQAFYRINVEATHTLLRMANTAGVKRSVVTSTAGVLGAAQETELLDESHQPQDPLDTHYERSKLESEEQMREMAREGFPVVIVNPSRVYGPGRLSESNSVTKMVKWYVEGIWRFIPGNGKSIGNYVYVDDVVEGHILAMERGRIGERYILGGDNHSFNDFFDRVGQVAGKRNRMFHIPMSLMMGASRAMTWTAEHIGGRPLITPPFVRKYNRHWPLSSEKARRELGYEPRSLVAGLQQTIEWLG